MGEVTAPGPNADCPACFHYKTQSPILWNPK